MAAIVEHLDDVSVSDSAVRCIFRTHFEERLGIELSQDRRVKPLGMGAPTRVLLDEYERVGLGSFAALVHLG